MFHLLNIPKKRQTWIPNLVIIAIMLAAEFALGTYALHNRLQPPIYELVYTGIAIIVILYSTQQLKKLPLIIVLSGFITLIAILGAGAVFALFGMDLRRVFMNPWYSFLGAMLGFVLFIFLYFIVKFMKINQATLGLKGMIFIVFGLISYGYYLAAYFVANYESRNSVWAGILSLLKLIGGVMTVIGSVLFVLKDNKLRESKGREKIQAQNYLLQQEHYTALYEKEERTKKFRHDIEKQLVICRELLEQDKTKELAKYLDGMLRRKKSIDEYAGIKTGSDFVDANLNELLSNAEYTNVKFNRNWNIPNNLIIDAMDITSLFMNLLTNAFEAAVQCVDEQFVRVHVKAHHNLLYISIENSYNGELKFEDEKLKTTKVNEDIHGYGFQIISDIINKYSGSIEIAPEDEKFVVEITFGKDIYVRDDWKAS